MFYDWLMGLFPTFHGDFRVLLGFVYLAAGAFVMLHAQGATKYYQRQWKSDDQPVIVFSSLIACILFWPLVLARKDVTLPFRVR